MTLSIDESMITYKGRHEPKQYLPTKFTKWGFKIFLLYESDTDYSFQIIFLKARLIFADFSKSCFESKDAIMAKLLS